MNTSDLDEALGQTEPEVPVRALLVGVGGDQRWLEIDHIEHLQFHDPGEVNPVFALVIKER